MPNINSNWAIQNGYFGVPKPPGLAVSSQNFPLASSIERTMFWLDRVAEQHDWVNRHPDPLIWASGFVWKRHNGLDLETFIPMDSPPTSGRFELAGYPVNSQEFWARYREILRFAGDKILQYWYVDGGQRSKETDLDGNASTQQSGLRGLPNGSGWMWKSTATDGEWITYGNYSRFVGSLPDYPYTQIYEGFLLDNPEQKSFVDYNESSKTKYMGRHGKFSKADYTQYVGNPASHKQLGIPFSVSKVQHGTKASYAKNFNSVGSDFKITRNPLMASSDLSDILAAISGTNNITVSIVQNGGGYITTLSSGAYAYNNHYRNGYYINHEQCIDAIGLLSPMNSGYAFDPITYIGAFPFFNACCPEPSGLTQVVRTPPLTISLFGHGIGSPYQDYSDYDYLDYTIDSDGYLATATIVPVIDRLTGYKVRQAESIHVHAIKTYTGLFIPLSRKIFSSGDNSDYYNDPPHYLRSITGFTPNDTLDVLCNPLPWGPYKSPSGLAVYTVNDIQRDILVQWSGYGTAYYCNGSPLVGCDDSSYTKYDSIPTPSSVTKVPYRLEEGYPTKLVYGHVNYDPLLYPGQTFSENPYNSIIPNLIGNAIDAGNYTVLGSINCSGGYTGVSFLPYDDIAQSPIIVYDPFGGFKIIYTCVSLSGVGGDNYTNWDRVLYDLGDLFHDAYYGTPPPYIYGHNTLNYVNDASGVQRVCSLSSLVDPTPPGNILFIAWVPIGDPFADLQSATLPPLEYFEEQDLIHTSGDVYYKHPQAPAPDLSLFCPFFRPRWRGEYQGSYNYDAYKLRLAPEVYAPDGMADLERGLSHTRLRAVGYYEKSKYMSAGFNYDPFLLSNNYTKYVSGVGVHTSYGAVQDSGNKYEIDMFMGGYNNGLFNQYGAGWNQMMLASNTYLWIP